MLDLLCRRESGWYVIDFKTDELRSVEKAKAVIGQMGYDRQVRRYLDAVERQLNIQPVGRLIFLNVNNHLAIFDLEVNPLFPAP